MPQVYEIVKPDRALPLVFDSPHSGCVYPADFGHACASEELSRTEDKYVDDLFACTPAYGASFLRAFFPRVYIDPNRAVTDIDPALLGGPWPYGDIHPTARSDAGIGLIRRLARPGVTVYNRQLSPQEIAGRIREYYQPYHEALAALLEETHYNFGQVWHVNCHSMPARSALPKSPIGFSGRHARAVDFCLGDRDGLTCSREFIHALRDFLRGLGYSVTINDPFKGLEIIGRSGSPARGFHAVQLEVNKSLYMDEDTQKKLPDYAAFKGDIEKLIAFCAAWAESRLMPMAAD